ncbi:hypothetical protein BU26DRAFT_284911 [Trematosphaeria pertusa]|uniref:Uncharacterized protein n=1 Tax=Trematosphaeria pertusa TaxID=390896 RepID=A0A6A6IPK8_9PLEO|nr:uncharacterized protein BU26DRAFT_284911 [Trematosphaeria pertusa]KAF2251520.1 hypothetical protein BU26DRAFT_284911 [Trematosphaeria pertusa]
MHSESEGGLGTLCITGITPILRYFTMKVLGTTADIHLSAPRSGHCIPHDTLCGSRGVILQQLTLCSPTPISTVSPKSIPSGHTTTYRHASVQPFCRPPLSRPNLQWQLLFKTGWKGHSERRKMFCGGRTQCTLPLPREILSTSLYAFGSDSDLVAFEAPLGYAVVEIYIVSVVRDTR